MVASTSMAIEPVEQQDDFGRPRKLQEIDQTGKMIYKEPKQASNKLTEILHRVWQERGDFNLVESDKLAEDPDFAIKPVEPDAGDEGEALDEDGKMSYEAMAKMRGELLQNLNMARNEIWLVFELARTLVAAANQAAAEKPTPVVPETKPSKGKKQLQNQPLEPGQPDTPTQAQPEIKPVDLEADSNPLLLPIGSITTSTSVNPYLPLAKQVRAMQLALATQKQATLKCATMFEEAVKQMSDTNRHMESYWESVQHLRNGEIGRGRWSLMAKPAFGVHAKATSNARDLAIPYALDEAGPSVRAQCLATFPVAHDSQVPLEYHARRHRRLRCQIITGKSKASSSPAVTEEKTPVQSLSIAQREVFDEEIFAECVAEVRRSNTVGSVVLKNSVSVPAGPDTSVIFSLHDTKDLEEATEPPSSLCDAVLSSAELLMLSLYRYRKGKAHLRNNETRPPPLIIQPIINVLRFKSLAARLRDLVKSFALSLRKAGFTVHHRELSSFSGVADWRAFFEDLKTEEDIGVSQLITIEGCPTMSVSVAPPDQINVSLPQATFAIEDLAELPDILARQGSQMLLGYLLRSIKESRDIVGAEVFVDELDDCLIVGRYSIYLKIRGQPGDVEAIASTADGEQRTWQASDQIDLQAWLRSLITP